MSQIKGIGTDMVSISRIERLWQTYGNKFAQRILSAKELALLEHKKEVVSFLAKRFAAKEAITKALGTGIGQVSFHDISVLNYPSGAPYVDYSPKTQAWLSSQQISTTHISLSDETDYALAFCVVSGS